MRESGGDLGLFVAGVEDLRIEFLSDVASGGSARDPHKGAADGAIQGVFAAGEPPGMIIARQEPFRMELDFGTDA